MTTIKKQALGRGLSVLLESQETDISSKPVVEGLRSAGSVSSIPLNQIEANPFQPRTHFEKDALAELAESIKTLGLIQPVTVRKIGNDRYQLISGERRFKASQVAGLTEIPAYIRIANDQSMLEMALVENLLRDDLDAIEVAIGFKRLIDECKITQEELSKRVSKQRSTITNYLRLLKLPAPIQLGIRDRKISMGHARALVNIGDEESQIRAYNDILSLGLSVRQVEDYSRTTQQERSNVSPSKNKHTPPRGKRTLSSDQNRALKEISGMLNSNVSVEWGKKNNGKITIPFSSENELNDILNLLEA